MNKELNEDARTKQDLLYECSSLKSMLSDAIVKNEQLQQENKKQKEVIDRAIAFYENNKQECVIGRTGEGKLRKDYYLPAHLSKTLINILKEVSE